MAKALDSLPFTHPVKVCSKSKSYNNYKGYFTFCCWIDYNERVPINAHGHVYSVSGLGSFIPRPIYIIYVHNERNCMLVFHLVKDDVPPLHLQ